MKHVVAVTRVKQYDISWDRRVGWYLLRLGMGLL